MNDEGQTVQDNYDEIFELNGAIVAFSRKKVRELREMAETHRDIAERYDEIADAVTEMSLTSAELIARGIATEAGLYVEDEEVEDDE